MDATRAPLELTLDGKKINFSPLELDDLGVLANKIGAKAINSAHIAARDTRDPAIQNSIIAGAYKFAASVEIMGPDMLAYIRSTDGFVTLMALSVRHNDPNFTYDDAFRILKDHTNRMLFAKTLDALLPGSKDVEGSSDPNEKSEESD